MITDKKASLNDVHVIFKTCFPALSLPREILGELLDYDTCTLFIHRENENIIGLCAVQDDCIRLLCVLPEYRRKGIATALLRECEAFIKQSGYKAAILGGFESQLFIGAVTEKGEWDEHDNSFFRKRGYSAQNGCIEMKLALSEYIPEHFFDMTKRDDITFDFYSGDKSELYKAVASVDDEWVQYFVYDNPVLVARKDGKVASFAILGYDDENILCEAGKRIGSVGCVGTVPEMRKQGIGLALVARGTEILKEHGCDVSFIHFTYLEDWYGKLGYKTFLWYWFGCKEL